MVSAVGDDSGRWLPAVPLIKLVVRNFHRKLSDVYFFTFGILLEYSLINLRVENLLDSRRF